MAGSSVDVDLGRQTRLIASPNRFRRSALPVPDMPCDKSEERMRRRFVDVRIFRQNSGVALAQLRFEMLPLVQQLAAGLGYAGLRSAVAEFVCVKGVSPPCGFGMHNRKVSGDGTRGILLFPKTIELWVMQVSLRFAQQDSLRQ